MAREPEKSVSKDDLKKEAEKASPLPSQLEPYPHGNPPDPEDIFQQAHGFRRAPAKEEKK